jgi:hypothetical protein
MDRVLEGAIDHQAAPGKPRRDWLKTRDIHGIKMFVCSERRGFKYLSAATAGKNIPNSYGNHRYYSAKEEAWILVVTSILGNCYK